MAGLVPATHKRLKFRMVSGGAAHATSTNAVIMGGRDKPGHDGGMGA
ncbi:hypothetical protein [Phenylobacterium conjunctum]|uniref:Uncharacterized protein n=1 Tax=Phenylobacterium conjunctum TaxID=1298959 RepID=A0ABW3T098_9CAUL